MIDGLLKFKEWMTRVLNWTLIGVVLLLVLSVVWGVLTRQVIGPLVVYISEMAGCEPWGWLPTGQAKWTEEFARFLLVWVALLGGAVAFGTKAHLGVDYFMGKFDPEPRKVMAVVAHLVVLFFAAAIFVYGGSRFVADTFAIGQKTPALGWEKGYIYLVIPISGVFMVLYTIENLIETILAKAGAEGEVE